MLGFVVSGLLGGLLFAQLTSTGDVRLDRVRAVMADNLVHLPNYTCLMTVDRSARQNPRLATEHEDTLHLEVADVGGKEIFGWPGTKLGEKEMSELIGRGLVASGDFATIATVIFRTRTPKFKSLGEKKLHGRQAVEYAF